MSRIAVTGASGYLAGGLVRRLESESSVELVLALDIEPPEPPFGPKVRFIKQDINAPLVALFERHGIDSVAHLAFVLNPGHRKSVARRVNVGGTVNLLDACVRSGVEHLLYLSSSSVYGARPTNPRFITEDFPIKPLPGFQYSEDKARAESWITEYQYHNPGFKATILRACPVMGPRADNFISSAFSRQVLVGAKGYDPPMQLIHEDDVTKAMWLCLVEKRGGVYNLAGSGTIVWSEMATTLGRKVTWLPSRALHGLVTLGWTLRLQSDSPSPGVNFIKYPWTVSTEKIRRDLGFQPRYSTQEAWAAFVERNVAAFTKKRRF